jgi:phage terminase large subunit-like protein
MRLLEQGVNMVEVRPTVLNFSEPMKELEAIVLAGKFRHNGDPVLAWNVSNTVCHVDAKDNIYPRKERNENKIDGVVALIMALNRSLAARKNEQDISGFLNAPISGKYR